MAARFMDQFGNIVLRMAVTLDELAIALRLFDRVQVLALYVLDQRNLGRSRIVNLTNDRRNGVQAGALRCAPPAFARDDLEPITMGTKEDRLKNTAFGDRIGELVDRFFLELHPRLFRVGADAPNLDLSHAARTRRCGIAGGCDGNDGLLAEKRLKAAAEPGCRLVGAHAASACRGRRPISSRARCT